MRSALLAFIASLSLLLVPAVAYADDVVISNITATPSSTDVTFQWTTDQAASSQVNYGTTSAYGSSTPETDLNPRVTAHSVDVTGLQPCTVYHYQLYSAALSFSVTPGTSGDATVTTAGCAATTTTNNSGLANTGSDSYYYLLGIGALIAIVFSLGRLKKQPNR